MPTLAVICGAFIAGMLALLLRYRFIAGLLLGIAWLGFHAHGYRSLIQHVESYQQPVRFSGTITQLDAKSYGLQMRLNLHRIEGYEQCCNALIKAALIIYDNQVRDFEVGQVLVATAKLKPAHAPLNHYGFNYTRWLLAKQVVAKGRLIEIESITGERGWRERSVAYLAASLSKLEQGGVILALLSGDKRLLPPDQLTRFREAGLSHLLVVSGLHIATVGLWVWGALSLLLAGNRFRASRLILCLAATLGYVALTGWALPALRALLMFSLVLLGVFYRQLWRPWQGLLLSALVIVLVFPFSVYDSSFYLSFAATAAVLLALWWQRTGKLKQLVAIQLVIGVMLLPLQLGLFGGVALFALPINLVMVPLFTLVVIPGCMMGLLLLGVSEPLSMLIWQTMGVVIAYVDNALASLSELSPLSAHAPGWLSGTWWLMLSSLLLLRSRLSRSAVLLAVLLAPSINLLLVAPQRASQWRVVVLDVGQGLSVVVERAGHVLLYDTGARYPSGFSFFEASFLPWWRGNGSPRVEHIVLSHADNDHAGAELPLLSMFPDADVYRGRDHRWSSANCNDTVDWHGLRLRLFHAEQFSGNNGSCLLLVEGPVHRVLISGDVERSAEEVLVEKGLPKVDVLVSPHHGSRSSSSRAWVRALKPQYVVHSAGFANQYGFPAIETLEAYRGAQQYVTASSGAVGFRISQSGVEVVSERSHRQRYWYHRNTSSDLAPDWVE
ncbi:DNA internalization-related competence protein ComEC/Rec2 [Aliagarivorans marinus]|uniref:DNA internalization-related competence protein ComEC/Rec2 n=1 Tax=Aliagarivorans marinus TaxID=561965 RepID=UPI0004122024|nr:DNA internalization-related competence protein ComEC/Rec2 [Aliagarivorans marinus]